MWLLHGFAITLVHTGQPAQRRSARLCRLFLGWRGFERKHLLQDFYYTQKLLHFVMIREAVVAWLFRSTARLAWYYTSIYPQSMAHIFLDVQSGWLREDFGNDNGKQVNWVHVVRWL